MRNKNQNVYTVGQVNSYIKNIFDQDYMLRRIYVSGEVSNCKYHPSGHIYFSLKDAEGTISCVMFAGSRRGLAFPMRDGDNVIVGGSISVYERDGKYQIYAKEITKEGAGLLYEKYLALKAELEEMGMFAPEYKQPIPRSKEIGVVTARWELLCRISKTLHSAGIPLSRSSSTRPWCRERERRTASWRAYAVWTY